MGQIIISGMSPEELLCLIEDAVGRQVEKKLRQIKNEDLQEKYLTVAEIMKLFSVSRTTIHSWSKEGHLKKHSIGGRVVYKYSEAISAASTHKKYYRK